ncbi:MAG: Eco57I restriction-modification methylase domain-containing protein [Salinibacter sp.]
MTDTQFFNTLSTLIERARSLLDGSSPGKPEENTKDKLLTPFLEALGYDEDHRTPEAEIKSLQGTSTWVDYFLLPEPNAQPQIMVEAKSLWETNLWEKHKTQVLEYLRDYKLMIGTDEPVLWLVLTNFREWYVLRLEDREYFWSFTMDDLGDAPIVDAIYGRLAQENLSRNRLQEFYDERQREGLGARFLADLKVWRLILANGLRRNHPDLSLAKTREASQVLLNRFLFIRLLEAYGQEPFYSLTRHYDYWKKLYQVKPFAEILRDQFTETWAKYNTELFTESMVDRLEIPAEYLEPLILPDAVPQAEVAQAIDGPMVGYRSIYNYDFTTITQDVLGTAYEQFLAHELTERNGRITREENQLTRKREGIYYTPSFVVKRIVHQTLRPRVQPRIDRAIGLLEQEQFEEAFKEASSVLELRVIDPACGSGSFLLGAFDYLMEEINRYNYAVRSISQQRTSQNDFGDLLSNHEQPKPQRIEQPEEQILVHVLHGVDLDPQAVSLAKLSLWTRLLKARPGHYGTLHDLPLNRRPSDGQASYYAQLPALRLNIRVGNSLIHSPATLSNIHDDLKELAHLARRAKDLSLRAEKRAEAAEEFEAQADPLAQQIATALIPFFASEESLRNAVRSIRNKDPDDDTLDQLREYLLGRRSAPNDWNETDLERLHAELIALDSAQDETLTKRPFTWEVEFPDRFDPELPEDERGFDVVLGNPPYYNVDATFGRGAPELDWLKTAFPKIHTDKTDVLFYFIRRSFQILRREGDLAFIVSRAFTQADKAKGLREFLSRETTLLHVLDFLGHKVFEAGIATCILHVRNRSPDDEHQLPVDNVLDFEPVREVLEGDDPLASLPDEAARHVEINQSELGEDRWSISPYFDLFKRIDAAGTRLADGDFGRFLKGIDTGLDEVFEGHFRDRFPTEWIRPRIPNSYLRKFGWKPSVTEILYIPHGVNWDSLPEEIRSYLEENQSDLTNRSVYQHPSSHYDWFHLHRAREHLFASKILFPRRASENRFAVDEEGNHACKSDVAALLHADEDSHNIYYICALLNSKVLEFRYRALGGLGKLTGRGMFEYFENQVGDLPIPRFDNPSENPDHQRLSELGREAHELFNARYQVVTTYEAKSRSIASHDRVPLWRYHDPVGSYRDLIQWESPNANREGHLLDLQVEPTPDGYVLWGEITEDEDWREGEREWIPLAEVTIKHAPLRRFVLAHAVHQTEFDESFQRKQKLTREVGNLVQAAFETLAMPHYDDDQTRNLKLIEDVEQRVAAEAERSDLETILLRQEAVETEIDDIAYRLYDAEAYRDVIEDALKVVL